MKVDISVRELVAFVMRSGSVDRPAATYSRLRQGTALHKLVQSTSGDNYSSEVPLSVEITYGELVFCLSGRADGIIADGDGVTVDEIKSTNRRLSTVMPEDYPEYTAQAHCYAYMYASANRLSGVNVRITFISTETHERESFDSYLTFGELEEKVFDLISDYYRFALADAVGAEAFRESAHKLKFPHKDYRPGQQNIVLDTFHTVRDKARLFIQAPTGLGKTLSVCYGAVKAVGEGSGRRIFYLTPKSTVSEAPEAAFELMAAHGLKARILKLTAKEKCCLCREDPACCQSDVCIRSNGHFDRINEALYELISGWEHPIDRSAIEVIARKHCVCPYELSLEASLFADVIICDCNYLFDPRVYLRRFFEDSSRKNDNIVLIDEAHDLVDRAREMYSAELSSAVYNALFAVIPENDFILYPPLKHLLSEFAALRKLCRQNEYSDGDMKCGSYLSKTPFDGPAETAAEFFTAAMEWLRVNGSNAAEVPFGTGNLEDAVKNAAFEARRLSEAVRLSDEKFLHLAERRGNDVKVRVLCIDPSKLLDIRMSRVRSTVLFSATLSPMDYYRDLLAGEDAGELSLPSPFDSEQLFCAIMHKVSLRYADRERTLSAVVDIIETAVNARMGNYLVFLPSYEMLRLAVHEFRRRDPFAEIKVQKPDMTPDQRRMFLESFREDGAVIGFAVLGGMFSESIDLAGNKLIGTVIVGTGLARINTETNIVADYFQEAKEAGFEYAYLYPAMNKVLQAVGRVIRSEEDRGVCILIDDRFATPQYSRLLTDHLRGIRLVPSSDALYGALDEFWEEQE